MTYSALAIVVYVVGVGWGLVMSDARPVERVALALLWPLGPLAFVVTVAVLLVASVIAYPMVMVPVAIAVAAFWWVLF
ncbi:MAG: hypothetical protein ACRD3C_10005 [Vicinamibacterales bacterium]